MISKESNPKVQPCVTLVEILGFFNIQIEDKGEIRVKKKIVAGMLGLVIVFGVGYFAGQSGCTETVNTPYSQSTSSVIDVKGTSQSTAENTSHSQSASEKNESTVETTPSVTDIQPRSRISNDINLTYNYDESTGIISIDWDKLAKNEYMRLDSLSNFSVMVQYSHPEDSDDFDLSVDTKELCHFIKDQCINEIDECKNPSAYSLGVRCYKKIDDIDDFYLVSLGTEDTPVPFNISWYDSENNKLDISGSDIEHKLNHLELKFNTTGNIKIEQVDVVQAETSLSRSYFNADLYDKIHFAESRLTTEDNEGYLMHTSNYYDVYNMAENERVKELCGEDVSCGTIEDTDNHNEIIELD